MKRVVVTVMDEPGVQLPVGSMSVVVSNDHVWYLTKRYPCGMKITSIERDSQWIGVVLERAYPNGSVASLRMVSEVSWFIQAVCKKMQIPVDVHENKKKE